MVNRRTAIGYLASSIATALALRVRAADPSADEEVSPDQDAADKWMQDWMAPAKKKYIATTPGASEKAAAGSLFVGRFADRMYFTASVIGWNPTTPAELDKYTPVRVPVGFVTDFASIPRVFWGALPPDGQYAYAAVVHDYLYWEQYLPREGADDILKFLMQDFKVNDATVWAVYNAVRIGGQGAWDGNVKLKRAGEQRVLKKTPDDPTIARHSGAPAAAFQSPPASSTASSWGARRCPGCPVGQCRKRPCDRRL